MIFRYGKQELRSLRRAQEPSFLLTNGLGGYASATAAWSVNRCDQGILVAAVKAPNERISMVHRLRERLRIGGESVYLSSQSFGRRGEQEEGFRYLTDFSMDILPVWTYCLRGVTVKRTLSMGWRKNAAAVLYEIENHSGQDCVFQIDPFLKFAPKEAALEEKKEFLYSHGTVTDGRYRLHIHTDGNLRKTAAAWQCLSYPEDD